MKNVFTSAWSCAVRYFAKCLILLFILLPLEILSQNRNIDSLKLLLADKSNRNYPDILHETSVELMLIGEYDSAKKYINSLYLLGKEIGDSLQLVRGVAIKASILRRSGKLDSAKQLYNIALPIAIRNSYLEQCANILNSLGNLYMVEARYDIALKCHFESLEIRERNGNKFDISIALHNIGLVCYKLSNYEKAL